MSPKTLALIALGLYLLQRSAVNARAAEGLKYLEDHLFDDEDAGVTGTVFIEDRYSGQCANSDGVLVDCSLVVR